MLRQLIRASTFFVASCLVGVGCAPSRDATVAPRAATGAVEPGPACPSSAPCAATSPLFAPRLERVAEGVYVFVAPEARSGLVSGNSVVVVGDDGALVVDTGRFPSLARAEIAAIRRLTALPVRYVVTSHFHGDHHLGNEAFREAFPGVVFLAHTHTRRLELARGPRAVERQAGTASAIERFRTMLRTGIADGQPIDDDDRRLLPDAIQALEQTVGDSYVKLVLPTQTFDDAVTVYLGRREVPVMHLGRGNTPGDVVVHVPDAAVVAAGDLDVAPVPYAYASYPQEWVATLRRIEALGASVTVPGHGPVQHDNAYLEQVVAMVEAVRAQAAAAVRDGLTLEEAKKKVDLAGWKKRFAGDDLFRGVAFDQFFATPCFERAYEEAKGPLKGE